MSKTDSTEPAGGSPRSNAAPRRSRSTVAKSVPAAKATAAKTTAAKDPAAKGAAAKRAATKTVAAPKTPAAKTNTAKTATTVQATGATKARTAFQTGAARAGGERGKRRSTPLLAPGVTQTAAPVVSPPSVEPEAEATTAGAAPSPGARRRGKHRPVPTITSTPSKKAQRQTGERRGPRPAERVTPTLAADRAPRRTPRERRAADDRVASHLRIAPDPRPATPDLAPLDPSVVAGGRDGGSFAVEDLLSAAISVMRSAAAAAGLSPEEIERRIALTLRFLRRRLEGDYHVDEFGYDPHFAENVIMPTLRPLYRSWFRVEVRGVENIPEHGAALIVANHSGTVAIDSLMLAVAVHDESPGHRTMRALGADLVFSAPVLGTWARRGGSTLATNADADRLFAQGHLVGVFPEGFKGVGKPFKERYKLQRFGRGGFVSSALKAEVPIIPVSIVGAEEVAPIIGNMGTLARLIGAPYFPVTPTFPLLGPLGLIPLPSKWIIEFGAPIRTDTYGSAAAEDPMLVFDLTDQIRETIQQTLYTLLMRRRSVFF